LLQSTTLSYVQYTDRRITVHQHSWYRNIMELEIRALMSNSLRYGKKIYHCCVTITGKAFPRFQPRINSTKT